MPKLNTVGTKTGTRIGSLLVCDCVSISGGCVKCYVVCIGLVRD